MASKGRSVFDINEPEIENYRKTVVDKHSTVTEDDRDFKEFMDAVSESNIRRVKELISTAKDARNKRKTYRGITTSALQIAAEINDFPMVELLFDNPLKDDIHFEGPIDQIVSLQSALSSPAYISISYLYSEKKDRQEVNKSCFLQDAFERSKQLTQLVNVLDYTIWKETLERLQESLTKFTVDILNSCITVDEVGKLLEGENDNSRQDNCNHFVCDRVNKELSLANKAIETKQKRFLVQEKCQHFLKQEWLRGQPRWAKKKGKLWGLIYLFYSIFVFGIICQLIPVQLFFCKGTRLQKFFHSPKTTLLTHYFTYASFLLLFFIYDVSVNYKIINSQIVVVSNINYWPILIMSLIWFGALFIDELVGIFEEGFRFFKSYWNLLDFFIFTFFVGSVILGNPLFFGTIYQNPYICIILSKLASLSFIFALLRLLKPLYLSHFFGPMLIIFTDMRHDIFRFLIIFGYVVLAFALAMYYFYVDLGSDQSGYAELSSSLTILITTIFGGDGTDDLQVDQNMRFNISSEFSRFASAAADYYVTMGYVLYTFFGIIVVIMLLNLCIAMMSDRYTRVQATKSLQDTLGSETYLKYLKLLAMHGKVQLKAYYNPNFAKEVIDLEWKFERTKIWMSYVCAKRPPMTPATTVCYLILLLSSPLIVCFRYFFCKGKVEDLHEDDQHNPEIGNVGKEEDPDNLEDLDTKIKQELAKLSYHKYRETRGCFLLQFLKLLLHRYYVKHLRKDETRSGKESQDQPENGTSEEQNESHEDLALSDFLNDVR